MQRASLRCFEVCIQTSTLYSVILSRTLLLLLIDYERSSVRRKNYKQISLSLFIGMHPKYAASRFQGKD